MIRDSGPIFQLGFGATSSNMNWNEAVALCPSCGGDLCGYCIYNELCQNCYQPLPDLFLQDYYQEFLGDEYFGG